MTSLTVQNQTQIVEGLTTYFIDQQIFKFKATIGCKEPSKTSNPDKLTNLELWGVNVDYKSYETKWTIHGTIQSILQQRIHVS